MDINYKEYMTSDMLEVVELTLNEKKLKEEFIIVIVCMSKLRTLGK